MSYVTPEDPGLLLLLILLSMIAILDPEMNGFSSISTGRLGSCSNIGSVVPSGAGMVFATEGDGNRKRGTIEGRKRWTSREQVQDLTKAERQNEKQVLC